MEFYHDLVTQKSWEELTKLQKIADFILIGGWAVYLYTQMLKSKDIDIITDYGTLAVLDKNYRMSKNERLKKYEAVREEIEIDIYLPHYSNLGIPVEDLTPQAQEAKGFKLLEPNFLTALKIYTLSKRGRSPKGRKDLIDIFSLIVSKRCNLKEVKEIIKRYNLTKEQADFSRYLNEHDRIPELNLNPHYYSKVKKEVGTKLFN